MTRVKCYFEKKCIKLAIKVVHGKYLKDFNVVYKKIQI